MPQFESLKGAPLVTVIVPVYNLGYFVIPCLESLKRQTYCNLEILIVDDGSTDDSLATCNQMALHDDRMRVLHKENGGLSSARNFGLANASGDYVMFVDGDDLLDCRAIEHLLALAERTGVQLVACRFKKVDSAAHYCVCSLGTYELVSSEEQLKRMLLLEGESGSACAKLYSKDLIPLLAFPEGQLFEDFGVEARVISSVDKVCTSDSELYGYVTREESITTAQCFGDAHLEGMERSLDTVKKVVAGFPSLTGALRCFEAFCSLRVASKLDIDLCSNKSGALQYISRSRRLCWSAAFSSLPTRTWRIRCALFSLSPRLHNFIYFLYGKATGRVIG